MINRLIEQIPEFGRLANRHGVQLLRVVAAGYLLLVAGCAANDPFADWDSRDLTDRIRRFAEREIDIEQTTKRVDPQAENHGEPMTVDWFVDQALAGNAEVRAARQRVERMRQRIPQAASLSDPTASVTFGELAQTAAGQVEYILGVQQSLPFPGTLDARAQVARKQVLEALNQLEAAIERVRGDTRRAYWSYYAAEREAVVLEQNRELLKQIESSVNSRARVGDAGQDDQLRVSRRTAQLENRLSTVKQRRRSSLAMLNRLMGRSGNGATPVVTIDEPQSVALDREQLVGSALQSDPRVRIAQSEAATFRSRLDLAKTERLPDLVLGVNYGGVRASGLSPVANGDDQVSATIGVSIPLWSAKYDASEREALRGIGEAIWQIRAAQDQATFEIDDAMARWEANKQVLGRLRKRMMPDARQTISVALRSYQTGKLDLLQLLDDWESLLDDQLDEARAIANMNRALADIEQVLGQRLNEEDEQP